ncbi:STAS domain-containing protein [Spirilliplanes yamanashiensis]|uniref:STAS domain-containing protein n=1 Tax=Spirilliplanes yamanashiensis TaxID=42233 RepID=A0A8J3Y9V6_9ACTN|nr:STAS domain-containing protein [Spirilliplanes yamanashiensis]MDP9815693.1 anti-sigma B factor antagonist [Spirilliplanes yamanashiensis]GIJ03947.1 hypothetical protein Sya03_32990 [Spirilliplanes yamanashiensis]
MGEPTYSIDRQDDAGTARLLLGGELDLAAREDLYAAIVAAGADADITAVVLDLRGVTFIDSEALGAVIEGHAAITSAGRSYSLVGDHGPVRRVLDIAGLVPMLGEDPA